MHRYLVRLENSKGYSSNDAMPLLIELRKAAYPSVVKNLRVTERALEFDLYVQGQQEPSIDALSRKGFGRLLNVKDLAEQDTSKEPTLFQSKEETVKLGVDLFNEQRYWECHETMEQIWRREKDPLEKDVQQGFILAASALVHFQKDENEVCLGMIPRALSKLEKWNSPVYFSLNVRLLTEKLKQMEKSRVVQPFTLSG